ncbi:MAG TPA: VOC family protein [Nitrospirota bacterium]|nr:VOC family protein [Nitrospirota bacterium]
MRSTLETMADVNRGRLQLLIAPERGKLHFAGEGGQKMNPVVHFEMPYGDRARMAKFYKSAFGWRTRMLGAEMGHYVLATTTETGESGPKRPGAINGGFYPKKPDWPAQYPSLVIAVDDVTKSMKKVKDAGGTVLGEPMDIPNVGQYVSFIDPEGNRVSMLQPIPYNWHAPKKQKGVKRKSKAAVKPRSRASRKTA